MIEPKLKWKIPFAPSNRNAHDDRRADVFCPNDFRLSYVLCLITSSILLRVNKFVWNRAESVLDHRFFILIHEMRVFGIVIVAWIVGIMVDLHRLSSIFGLCFCSAVVWVCCIDLVFSAFASILVDSICHTNGVSSLVSLSPSPCLPLALSLALFLSFSSLVFTFQECVHFIAVIAPINWHK